MRRLALSMVAAVLLAVPAVAAAKDVRYAGSHPRTGRPDGGFCFLEVVHVHPAVPVNLALYRQVNGLWVFVGDPVPFGWDGPRVRYYGHHPVAVQILLGSRDGHVYCYLDGPHWHPYEPLHRSDWERKDDVYYFTGAYPQEYERDKPRYVAPVNEVYRPIVYERPVVVGPPPPAYHGPVLDVRIHLPAPPAVIIGVPAPPPVIVIPAPPPGHQKKFKKFKHKKFKGKD